MAYLIDRPTQAIRPWTRDLRPQPACGRRLPSSASRISRFDLIAAQTATLPPGLQATIGLLLKASNVSRGDEPPALQSLWATEAINRTVAMLRLLGRQAARNHHNPASRYTLTVDQVLACSLARGYRSLAEDPHDAPVACSAVLREIVTDLVNLFGGSTEIDLHTNIERSRLPAFKRRALVQCASELVLNSLAHAFDGRSRGRIEVDLHRRNCSQGCLRVVDNGVGFDHRTPHRSISVAAELATLLEAELLYRRTRFGRTVAEVVFAL